MQGVAAVGLSLVGRSPTGVCVCMCVHVCVWGGGHGGERGCMCVLKGRLREVDRDRDGVRVLELLLL